MRSTHSMTLIALSGRDVEQTSLALLAARAAAAVKRLSPGEMPDNYDLNVLSQVKDILNRAAEAAQFVSTNGQHGSAPKAFAAVGLAFAVASRDQDRDPGAVKTTLEHIAKLTLNTIEGTGNMSERDFLLSVFERLADAAMSGLASPGDSQFQL